MVKNWLGGPGQLSWLSIQLKLRSWSCGSWVRALASGSVLTDQTLESASDFMSHCFSAPYLVHFLSLSPKYILKKKKGPVRFLWSSSPTLRVRIVEYFVSLESHLKHSSSWGRAGSASPFGSRGNNFNWIVKRHWKGHGSLKKHKRLESNFYVKDLKSERWII